MGYVGPDRRNDTDAYRSGNLHTGGEERPNSEEGQAMTEGLARALDGLTVVLPYGPVIVDGKEYP